MTARIKRLHQQSKERGTVGMPSRFLANLHGAALGRFADLPHDEKLARSMAYAIENMDVFAYEDDRIGGKNRSRKLSPSNRSGGRIFCSVCEFETATSGRDYLQNASQSIKENHGRNYF